MIIKLMNIEPKNRKFKLNIELVPSSSWCDNLRKVLSKTDWDKIRRKTYADYKYRCGICGAEGKMNCHEVWEYDDKNYIQKLTGFIALCDMCHYVKHIGLAGVLASEGKLNYKKVIEHFAKVNNCSKEDFEIYMEIVFEQWSRRSQHNWSVDLGEYKK